MIEWIQSLTLDELLYVAFVLVPILTVSHSFAYRAGEDTEAERHRA